MTAVVVEPVVAAGTPKGNPAATPQEIAAAAVVAAAVVVPVVPAVGTPAPVVVVPESYALALPAGSLLDPKVAERVTAVAKALGLTTSAQAQQVLDLAHTENAAMLAVLEAANKPGGSLYVAKVAEYRQAALAHPAVGKGSERTLEAITLQGQLVLNRLDPDGKITALLTETGRGSDPEVLRFLHRIHTLTGEKALAVGEVTVPVERPASLRDNYTKDGDPVGASP